MTVYVDDAFEGDWGKWSGGGHLQADDPDELHDFATRIGLKPSWFQTRPGRPERDHYDLTASRRRMAVLCGAREETAAEGSRRRRGTG
jgi:hypothetical protein